MTADPERDDAPARAAGGWRRGRRLARTLAFQTLYEMDVSRHRPGEVLQRLLTEGPEGPGGASVPPEAREPEVAEFARELVAGVLRQRAELDQTIQESAPAFPFAQMSPIDRNILRIGIYECLYTSGQVPVRVAVNEAVELAKRYGSESAPRFVNGVLGQVLRRRNLPDTGAEAEPS